MAKKDELKEQLKEELLDEIKEEVEKKTKEKSKSKNIIIGILLIIIAGLLFFIGYNWMDKNFLPMDKVDSGEEIDNEVKDEDLVVDDNNQNESVEAPIVIPQGSSEGITDSMKTEMKKIGLIIDGINQISCGSHMLLMSNNQKLEEFTYDQKLGIVSSYARFNNLVIQANGEQTLTRDNYYNIAKKYGFTEDYETIFGSLDKDSNGNYILPVSGCTSPSYLVHNVSFINSGNTITMINDMKIVDTMDNTEKDRKVVYTFQVNNGSELVLKQVNYQ